MTVLGDDGLARPVWAASDPLMQEYYDTEWGMPVRDERGLFERLSLEAFQSGLSWATILRKRPAFRAAFDDFDPDAVAGYDDADVERLMADAGIVRNRRKVARDDHQRPRHAWRCARTAASSTSSGRSGRRAPRPRRRTPRCRRSSPESLALSKALRSEGVHVRGPDDDVRADGGRRHRRHPPARQPPPRVVRGLGLARPAVWRTPRGRTCLILRPCPRDTAAAARLRAYVLWRPPRAAPGAGAGAAGGPRVGARQRAGPTRTSSLWAGGRARGRHPPGPTLPRPMLDDLSEGAEPLRAPVLGHRPRPCARSGRGPGRGQRRVLATPAGPWCWSRTRRWPRWTAARVVVAPRRTPPCRCGLPTPSARPRPSPRLRGTAAAAGRMSTRCWSARVGHGPVRARCRSGPPLAGCGARPPRSTWPSPGRPAAAAAGGAPGAGRWSPSCSWPSRDVGTDRAEERLAGLDRTAGPAWWPETTSRCAAARRAVPALGLVRRRADGGRGPPATGGPLVVLLRGAVVPGPGCAPRRCLRSPARVAGGHREYGEPCPAAPGPLAQGCSRKRGRTIAGKRLSAERDPPRRPPRPAHRAVQPPLLRRWLAECRTGPGSCLMLIDLDDFKLVNDVYGHAVGDKALAGSPGSCAAASLPADLALRLGGDEFAMVLADRDGAEPRLLPPGVSPSSARSPSTRARLLRESTAGTDWGRVAPAEGQPERRGGGGGPWGRSAPGAADRLPPAPRTPSLYDAKAWPPGTPLSTAGATLRDRLAAPGTVDRPSPPLRQEPGTPMRVSSLTFGSTGCVDCRLIPALARRRARAWSQPASGREGEVDAFAWADRVTAARVRHREARPGPLEHRRASRPSSTWCARWPQVTSSPRTGRRPRASPRRRRPA